MSEQPDARQLAAVRAVVAEEDLERWHSTVYAGCSVPSPAYVGRFRGAAHPDLTDHEVGVGPMLPDGYPDRVGVWAAEVARETAVFLTSLTLRPAPGGAHQPSLRTADLRVAAAPPA